MDYSQLFNIDKSLNIIIYGAGTLGRIVYYELLEKPNIKIVGWSDKKYNRINDAPMEIISPQSIKNLSCDLVILTLNDEKEENRICSDLIKMGIDASIISLCKNDILEIMKKEIEYCLVNDDFARQCFIERLLYGKSDYDKLKAEIYKFFIYCARIRYWGKALEARHWYMGEHSDIAYLRISKCACTSIISSLIDKKPEKLHKYAEKKYEICGNIPQSTSLFKFTYVRNPFERLVSCYVNRVQSKDGNCFMNNNYCMGILDNIQSFDEFVKCIVRIPVQWADRHFKLQYSYIYENGKKLVDYIGKVEDLENDYSFIQKKYGVKELENLNKSNKGDWKLYYSKENAKLVYDYYKEDILTFGYEADYYELLEYLDSIDNKNL